jgi:rhamnogalacturonyl hydrolase YesR
MVPDYVVGDPASLGVSALLIGQSNGAYLSASYRQADYILNQAPKYSNGAISQRPDVAELWADWMHMAPPFLAYLAVQNGSTDLMNTVVTQCGLQRAVLKGGNDNWMHIVGPQSPDSGLWSTGNGWAAYGMVRVLFTLQKWSGSASMTSQASQLQGWIKEILDGAVSIHFANNYLHISRKALD